MLDPVTTFAEVQLRYEIFNTLDKLKKNVHSCDVGALLNLAMVFVNYRHYAHHLAEIRLVQRCVAEVLLNAAVVFLI